MAGKERIGDMAQEWPRGKLEALQAQPSSSLVVPSPGANAGRRRGDQQHAPVRMQRHQQGPPVPG